MPKTTIEFDVNDRRAIAGFDRLQREIQELNTGIGNTRRVSEIARTGFQQMGQSAGRAGGRVDQFGRELKTTQRNTQETTGALDRLQKEFRELQAELQRTQAPLNSVQRNTTLLANARAVAVGDTNPAIQQLERSLERSQSTAAALRKEIELLKNGFQDLVPAETTQAVTNYALELEKLKAAAEDTRRVFTASETNQQLTPNFQAALAASNAYYAERIRQAETALAKEKEGTEAFNALQVEIFQLGRQRLAAQRTLETQRTRILRTSARERVRIEQEANNEIITGLSAVVRASRDALRARVEFARQVAVIPRASSPDAQYGDFTSRLRQDFQETERQGRRLLDVMRQITSLTFDRFDLDARIPDPGVRQQAIDARIAAETRGTQTLEDIRQHAREKGRQFLDNIISSEERAVQASLRKQARSYRQFANLVSNTFINLATGRAQNFEQVATAFIQQSLRIVLRAYVEYQIQKRLDDTLTASKIANIQKVAAAQQTGGLAGNLLGNLPGLGNLGNLLSGGGAGALGVAGLLFPSESRNLLGGIKDEISGFLSNVADVPDRAFGAQQQVFLKIGDNEVRDITDIQTELQDENRV